MADIGHLETEAQDFLMGRIFCGAVGMENMFAPLSDLPRSQQPVPACHVFLTAPFYRMCGHEPYSMSLHEQWTARLSALLWKRYNGPIHLITDNDGARYFHEIGLDQAYDSVQTDLWDCYGLNQEKFWASGKLLALERLQAPCMIIDMDLLVWRPLPLRGEALAAAHIEHLSDRVYPDTDYFIMSPKYQFPSDWDYTAEPLNTSLLYLGHEELRKEYLREAFRFMRYERDTPDNGSICMTFAEQRILAMCAARRKLNPKVFLDYDNLIAAQPLITHTWSAKRLISRHPDVEAIFVACCKEKCAELMNNTGDIPQKVE
ncbi:MAG: hypothetical protein IJE08_13480 [Clostridia bacterium]|nr:hypothetical protein [Clostridia bacterium]